MTLPVYASWDLDTATQLCCRRGGAHEGAESPELNRSCRHVHGEGLKQTAERPGAFRPNNRKQPLGAGKTRPGQLTGTRTEKDGRDG